MKLVEGRTTIDDVDEFVSELTAIGDAHESVIQAFDARYIAGPNHLQAAARSARRAREHDDTIADDPAVELLLYAAGRRQIDRALGIGVKEGDLPLVVVIDGENEDSAVAPIEEHLEPADTIGVARDEGVIRRYFDIGDAELQATDASLEELVVERVALLAIER